MLKLRQFSWSLIRTLSTIAGLATILFVNKAPQCGVHVIMWGIVNSILRSKEQTGSIKMTKIKWNIEIHKQRGPMQINFIETYHSWGYQCTFFSLSNISFFNSQFQVQHFHHFNCHSNLFTFNQRWGYFYCLFHLNSNNIC